MARVEVPHFRHPFTRPPATLEPLLPADDVLPADDLFPSPDAAILTSVSVVEQGSTEHIASQELNVIACPVGWRTERPEYGWPMPMFKTAPLDPGPLEDALRQFVPDSTATVAEYADEVDASIRHMSVNAEVGQGSDSG